MKTNLLKRIVFTMLLFSMLNCSVESLDQTDQISILSEVNNQTDCEGNLPQARIINNGTVTINFEVLNENLDLLNHQYDISANNVSAWLDFETGETLFVITLINVRGEKVKTEMDFCSSVEFEINSNNELIVNDFE
jgi:hypothetical protein